jgi:hypothetical protein
LQSIFQLRSEHDLAEEGPAGGGVGAERHGGRRIPKEDTIYTRLLFVLSGILSREYVRTSNSGTHLQRLRFL